MKLISLTRINDDFADLTFLKSVYKGWFVWKDETITERIVTQFDSSYIFWKFANTGDSIDSIDYGNTIGKAFSSLKKGETFHFIPQHEPSF